MPNPVRILLVDDNPTFLTAAERLLTSRPSSFAVVGRACSGEEALERVVALQPDLVLMDVAMPGLNGLEATRRIKAEPDPPRVIVLTLHDGAVYRDAARNAGADGFVSKARLDQALVPLARSLFPQLEGPVDG